MFKVTPSYTFTPPRGAPTLVAGPITFFQLNLFNSNNLRTAHWTALDGDCRIEIEARWDPYDSTASSAIPTAIRTIHRIATTQPGTQNAPAPG